jgi:PTH1 family peptidyl-tRNA hydrolase
VTADPDRMRGAFRSQGRSCALLGSPFMGRLMPLVGDRLTAETGPGARILSWEGDVGPAGQSVPLRLAGALHALALDGSDPGLAAAYPPNESDDDTLWRAVHGALDRHGARIMEGLDRAPQTNEVRRSAILLPALWWCLARTGQRPVALSELGASAGLNLSLDRFAIETPDGLAGPADSPVRLRPDWRGPPPPARPLEVADRAGVDRHPLDPADSGDALRLLSFLWPDQPERMALTRGAIALATTRPAEDDAAPWLARRLAERQDGRLHVVYSTIAWQYFPERTQDACTAALEEAGARADADAPLAHIAFEADGDREGAGLRVRLWPHAPEARALARGDFHGRWVDWRG